MLLSVFHFLIFAFSQIATPGPANMIMLATGAKYGFRNALPFVFGVIVGKQIIIWPIGFSLLLVNDLIGRYSSIMMVLSIMFISWIGYKIIFMDLSVKKKSTIWAPKFYHGLLVHPLNPKAWMMITLAFTAFQSQGVSTETIPTIAITFLLIQLIFHSAWFWFGSLVRQADLSEKNSRIVKIALLISLIASIVFSYY